MRDYTPGPHFYDGMMGDALYTLVHLQSGDELWLLDHGTGIVERAELADEPCFCRSSMDADAVSMSVELMTEDGGEEHYPHILRDLGDTLFLTKEDAAAARETLQNLLEEQEERE